MSDSGHKSTKRRVDNIGRRRMIMRGLAVFLGLAGSLACGEVGIRMFAPFPSYVHEMNRAYPADQYHQRYGWIGISNLDTRFALWEFSTQIRNNKIGFRDDSFDTKLAASKGKQRVIFLGDSYIWGWGIAREQRISEQLAALDPSLATFNLGQAGYGTDQAFLVLQDLGEQLRPDIVVLLLCCNDFEDVSKQSAYGQDKPKFVSDGKELRLTGVPVRDKPEWWERKQRLGQQRGRGAASWLITRSHLYNWLSYKFNALAQTAGARPGDATRERTVAADTNQTTLMAMLLDAIGRETQRLKARLVVVLIPQREQVANEEVDRSWQAFVKTTCSKLGIECFDLLPAFKGQTSAYWRLDPHWTPRGHRLGAEALLAYLREE